MLAEINEEIRKSLAQNRRNSDECQLIAVSKKQPLDAILKVFHEGQTAFGENYVQEGVEKIQQLSKDIRAQSVWHMIGPLQSNKAKLVAQHFDWVQTITSLKTAQKLSQHREEGKPLNICIQINIDDSDAKSGVASDVKVITELALSLNLLPSIKVRGLMAMPDVHTEEETLACFKKAKMLFDKVKIALGQEVGHEFDTLSMGMSGDFPLAIQAGATMVRIGTAVFGARQY